MAELFELNDLTYKEYVHIMKYRERERRKLEKTISFEDDGYLLELEVLRPAEVVCRLNIRKAHRKIFKNKRQTFISDGCECSGWALDELKQFISKYSELPYTNVIYVPKSEYKKSKSEAIKLLKEMFILQIKAGMEYLHRRISECNETLTRDKNLIKEVKKVRVSLKDLK